MSTVDMCQYMPATWTVVFHRNLYNSFYTDKIIPTLVIVCMRQGQDSILQACLALEPLILQVPKLLHKNISSPRWFAQNYMRKFNNWARGVD